MKRNIHSIIKNISDSSLKKLKNSILSKQEIIAQIKKRKNEILEQNKIGIKFDGILKEILRQDSKIASVLISRIKIISGLDISERRLPQDGRVSLSLGDKSVDVRV